MQQVLEDRVLPKDSSVCFPPACAARRGTLFRAAEGRQAPTRKCFINTTSLIAKPTALVKLWLGK